MQQVTVRAKRTVSLILDVGGKASPRVVTKDQIYAPDDPIVVAFPDEFSAFREVPIEQATAAPGERRGDVTR